MGLFKREGSVFGGALLITGSCIGAGMLGLPILVGRCGFFPSLLLLFLAWGFMTYTSLLLIEVGAAFSPKANIVTLSSKTLGFNGKAVSWALYLFLFYSLLIAYISAGGSALEKFSPLSKVGGSLAFTAFFGSIIYLGKKFVDYFNRGLMALKIFPFLGLFFIAIPYIKPELYLHHELIFSFAALPILVISFGFQNMNPVLMDYLNGNVKKVKKSILYGSFFVLIFYLFWNFIVLGVMPINGAHSIIETLKKDQQAAFALACLIQNRYVAIFVEGFAFIAIITSFLGQSLGMVHFLGDGLNVKNNQENKRENGFLCLLTLLPPLLFACLKPELFYAALNFAGGICAVLLFGILPVLMVWKKRYGKKKIKSNYQVFGGKPLLIAISLFAITIFFFQLCSMLHLSFIPK